MKASWFSLALFAILAAGCGKKRDAQSPASTPAPASQPQVAAKPFRAVLIGVWEREPLEDHYPFRMEFRADGTATLRHRTTEGRDLVNTGKLTAPETVSGRGPFAVQIKQEEGMYGLYLDFDGATLLLIRTEGKEPLRFQRVKG